MLRQTKYLSSRYNEPDGWSLSAYERDGGYKQAKRVFGGMTREALIDDMKAANIRGRGGAGFAMGVKWSFMPWPPKPEKPHYLVINADEGERSEEHTSELQSHVNLVCRLLLEKKKKKKKQSITREKTHRNTQ